MSKNIQTHVSDNHKLHIGLTIGGAIVYLETRSKVSVMCQGIFVPASAK